MRNILGSLFVAILLICAVVGSSFAGGSPLIRQPETPRINPGLAQYLSTVEAEETVTVWVFFTDKGVFTEEAYRQALGKTEALLLPKARARRLRARKAGNLIGFADLPVRRNYIDDVLAQGCRHRTTTRWLNGVSVEATPAQIQDLARLDCVRELCKVASYVRHMPQFEDGIAVSTGSRSLDYGPSFGQLNQINVPAVHDLGYNGAGALICMLDTGFKRSHEAIVNINVIAEWDFIHDDDNTDYEPGEDDPFQPWHGTVTLSTIGGFKEGSLIGPAYGADFILGKTEETTFEMPVEEDWWVEGAEWADSLGADVISSSLIYTDWYDYSDMTGDFCVTTVAADQAASNGIVVCNAMGNNGHYAGSIGAPADADSIVSCGSVNIYGELSGFSSIGPTYDGRIKPEVVAMGENTYAANPENNQGYIQVSGTSLSTPLVGGVAAILVGAHPDWTVMEVREALMMTASQASSPDNYYGWGILDALAALNYEVVPNVSVELVPDAVAVPRGGTLWFWATLTNNTGDPQIITAWTEVKMPNGNPYPGNPLLGPAQLNIGAFEVKNVHVNHHIPYQAPLGIYTYTGKLGTYPDDVTDEDSFDFEVVTP